MFVFFFVTFGYFFQGGGWNQNTRICLTRAIIHEQTFRIDRYRESVKEKPYSYFTFLNAGDWALYNGHYYSNKSPGLSFMAVVPFGIAEYAAKKFFPNNEEKQVLFSTYCAHLCTTVLAAVVLCLLMYYLCCAFFNFSRNASMLLTFFFSVGTLVFGYSTTFYSHVPAACFAFLAFVLAMRIKHGRARQEAWAAVLSGGAASMAALIEPSAIIPLGFVALYLFSFKRGRSLFLLFLLGCLPSGGLQVWYNIACFGGPLSVSYSYSNPNVLFPVNGRLFGLPGPHDLKNLLFLPYRGLLCSSPVFIMLIPGVFSTIKQRRFAAELLVCLLISGSMLLFIAGFHAWHGGNAVGPRYLVPAFPFGFVLTVFAFQRFSATFKVVGLLSIVINLAITTVGNEVSYLIKNPLTDVVLHQLLQNNVAVNPVPISNFENYPDLNAVFMDENWFQAPQIVNFNSFNFGELLFPFHLLSLLPLFCFWMLWACWWKKNNT